MNRIVAVLMHRDGMEEAEAVEYLQAVRAEARSLLACGRGQEVEDLLACELGLEPDYLMELIVGGDADELSTDD